MNREAYRGVMHRTLMLHQSSHGAPLGPVEHLASLKSTVKNKTCVNLPAVFSGFHVTRPCMCHLAEYCMQLA